jgi:hypothetical protein
MIWIVGRNKHTKEWSEGDKTEDYPVEHWEVFRVEASDCVVARCLAQQKRRRLLLDRRLQEVRERKIKRLTR